METKYGVILIAWCTDDGPDGKKMRRLLVAVFPHLIVILCWAHQINLIVGDCLAIRRSVMDDINHALDVVKWFNNHGTALELLRQEQVLTFEGLSWALILPVITRWTAHYLALSRVLKVKQPLQICWTRNEDKLITCAGTKEELQQKARQIRDIVRDEGFWYRIGRYFVCPNGQRLDFNVVVGFEKFSNHLPSQPMLPSHPIPASTKFYSPWEI